MPSEHHQEGHDDEKSCTVLANCAAFLSHQRLIFASERLFHFQKHSPREKKALTFFHGDDGFFCEDARRECQNSITTCYSTR